MMIARLLVYVYRAYTFTTVTALAFNYARASRCDAPAGTTYVHLNTVSQHFGAETKIMTVFVHYDQSEGKKKMF